MCLFDNSFQEKKNFKASVIFSFYFNENESVLNALIKLTTTVQLKFKTINGHQFHYKSGIENKVTISMFYSSSAVL